MMKDLIPTGEIPDSVCPRCGNRLIVITKRGNEYYTLHPQFIGCTQYPFCGYVTSKITPEIALKMEAVQAEREAMPVDF